MIQSHSHDFIDSLLPPDLSRVWKLGSVAATLAAIAIAIMTFTLNRFGATGGGLLATAIVLGIVGLTHARFLFAGHLQNRQTSERLFITERQFQSLFANALDAILVFDDEGICQSANPSCSNLLGSDQLLIVGQSIRLFFSDAREFDAMCDRLFRERTDRGEAELVCAGGRTVFADYTAAAHFLPHRHLMILRDITSRRRTQEALSQSLAVARSSWQEADALRKATLALTEDLRMDRVLDTLLDTLGQLVPYERAQILLVEEGSRLFLAREAGRESVSRSSLSFPETLDAFDFPALTKVLTLREALSSADLHPRPHGQEVQIRSWIGVPLISSNEVLGVLSLAHSQPARFSPEHFRFSRSLSSPAAVAIQNARLHERAEIYCSELEQCISELREAEFNLQTSEWARGASEEGFQSTFRSAPVAMLVISHPEGRFVEINEAFERCSGFVRRELMGSTSAEFGLWQDPNERTQLVERLRSGDRLRGIEALLRMNSQVFPFTIYSAGLIELEGQSCLLVVIEDPAECVRENSN